MKNYKCGPAMSLHGFVMPQPDSVAVVHARSSCKTRLKLPKTAASKCVAQTLEDRALGFDGDSTDISVGSMHDSSGDEIVAVAGSASTGTGTGAGLSQRPSSSNEVPRSPQRPEEGKKHRARNQKRDTVAVIEGQPVVLDTHGVEGLSGHYKRYFVQCTHSFTTHPSAKGQEHCCKSRNIGPRQTKNFGAKEPLAYVGAWLVAADQFDSRAAHVAFCPSVAMVRAYIETNELPEL